MKAKTLERCYNIPNKRKKRPTDRVMAYEIIPLIPDCLWLTPHEIHQLIIEKVPDYKLSNTRIMLCIWNKKGWVTRTTMESSYLYRRADNLFKPTQNKTIGARKCNACGNGFFPATKFTFRCPRCSLEQQDWA